MSVDVNIFNIFSVCLVFVIKWLTLVSLNLNIYDQSTANFPESLERVKIRNLLLDNTEYNHVMGNVPKEIRTVKLKHEASVI